MNLQNPMKSDLMRSANKAGNQYLLLLIMDQNQFSFKNLTNTTIINHGEEKAFCIENGAGDFESH